MFLGLPQQQRIIAMAGLARGLRRARALRPRAVSVRKHRAPEEKAAPRPTRRRVRRMGPIRLHSSWPGTAVQDAATGFDPQHPTR
jgi:hypothetical protein